MAGTSPAMTTGEVVGFDPSSWRRDQIGRRDQHAEALAPDHHAGIVLEIDAGRDRIALAALERAQAAEIDIHQLLDVIRAADVRLRREEDVEGRSGPDLEVAFQEYRALVHADLAASPVDRFGRIGMDEGS